LYTALKAALPTAPSSSSTTASSTFSGTAKSGHPTNAASHFTEETLLVGRMLLRDFERYGVHLSGPAQDQMTHLVGTTQALGFAFTQNIIDPGRCGQLKLTGNEAISAVERLPYELKRLFRPWQHHREDSHSNLTGSVHGLVMSGTSSSLASLITHSDDEVLRKEAYTVYCTSPRENLKILDQLVNARHEMAALMGFESYAAYQLDNFSLAATPHAVETFLEELATAVKPAAEKEAFKLTEIKRRNSKSGNLSLPTSSSSSALHLEPWDRDWAINKATHGGLSEQLARYFEQHVTLDGCLAGVSLLLEKTLDIKIIEETRDSGGENGEGMLQGEIWAPGVRKLRVVDCTTEAFLGIVYLDLYKRENKFPGAAHFTLRCGKRTINGVNGEYQTPVVALVANFRNGGGGSVDTSSASHYSGKNLHLNHREVETFFHEFGHALNSLLSRTEYQHLSGTRGPQDVIEIPSHVLERFSLDYETIKMLVHLSQHGSSTASGAASGTSSYRVENKQVEKTAEMLAAAAIGSKQEFAALTLQSTLSLCAIDQLLHGKNPPEGTDAEREIAGIMQKYNSIYEHLGGGRSSEHHRLHPHIRFNHLIGYGSNYYCYLFAQCISSSLWEGNKTAKITENEAKAIKGAGFWPDGQVLRRQLLEPGGAKPAHQYVTDLFHTPNSTSSSTHTERKNTKNDTSTDMLVMVTSPEESGRQGWYPRFDSLLRHLGIYK
jgi:intermediate peptidase